MYDYLVKSVSRPCEMLCYPCVKWGASVSNIRSTLNPGETNLGGGQRKFSQGDQCNFPLVPVILILHPQRAINSASEYVRIPIPSSIKMIVVGHRWTSCVEATTRVCRDRESIFEEHGFVG